jgi:hypothetical protein
MCDSRRFSLFGPVWHLDGTSHLKFRVFAIASLWFQAVGKPLASLEAGVWERPLVSIWEDEDHQIYQVEIWVDGWMKEKSKVNIFSERFKFLRLLSSAVPVSRRQVAKALDEKLSKLPSNQRSSFLVGALGSPFLCRWEQ